MGARPARQQPEVDAPVTDRIADRGGATRSQIHLGVTTALLGCDGAAPPADWGRAEPIRLPNTAYPAKSGVGLGDPTLDIVVEWGARACGDVGGARGILDMS